MPLWVMITAGVGVSGIVALTWLLGGLSSRRIDRARVDNLFAREEPPDQVDKLVITKRGDVAVALLASGKTIVVRCVGDGLAWRAVKSGTIRRCAEGYRISAGSMSFMRVTIPVTSMPPRLLRALGVSDGDCLEEGEK